MRSLDPSFSTGSNAHPDTVGQQLRQGGSHLESHVLLSSLICQRVYFLQKHRTDITEWSWSLMANLRSRPVSRGIGMNSLLEKFMGAGGRLIMKRLHIHILLILYQAVVIKSMAGRVLLRVDGQRSCSRITFGGTSIAGSNKTCSS